MSYIYVLDRLINKPIKLKISEQEKNTFKSGEKILYKYEDTKWEFVGTYIWYGCDSMKEWSFIRKFGESEEKKFESLQERAKKLFEIFKNEFRANFKESVPVAARFDYGWNLIYFYFYAETRFDFANFIKDLRKKVNCNFFLFQIGARDRVRMSIRAEKVYWTCDELLCCKTSKCPLPTVDSENIALQALENRWIEKIKWICWKLKCCLNYEKKIYEWEQKKYPKKWEEFRFNWERMKCFSFNVMNWEIIAKSIEENHIKKINIKDLQKNNKDA